ncbi:MAG: hypothetical protein OQJ89_05625 [Kangiellaceae bacterium]|nr:hypothetical protein [Kangiellaceae bacterium]MCW8998275.1 hypothetical protein [Kangiellaceae bacterium]MCW9016422.1 hypothetical protein [Kangiellaceae bacterium]
MKLVRRTLAAMLLGATAMGSMSVVAFETKVHKVMVKVDKSGDEDAVVDLNINGSEDVFVLEEMEVGETKTFTTQSGKEVVVAKTDKGTKINVDGKDIDIPISGANLAAKLHRSMPLHHMTEDSIRVSGVDLDDNQKQIIRDGFAAAGIDKKVTFSNDNIFVFSSDNIETDGKKVIEWISDNKGTFDIEVKGDHGQLHKVIEIVTEEETEN